MFIQMHKIKTTNRDLVYTELIQTLMSDAILKVIRYSFTVAIYYVSISLMTNHYRKANKHPEILSWSQGTKTAFKIQGIIAV